MRRLGRFEVYNIILRDTCRTTDTVSSVWHGTFWALLERWQPWVKMRDDFGGHYAWQALYVVNLDALKGSTVKLSSLLFWT